MTAILLCALLAIAVVTDIRRRRIPNALVLIGLVLGSLLQLLPPSGLGPLHPEGGVIGLLSALPGVAVGFAALFPLYLLRAMGAGDVKLMMMVGAFLGPLQTFGVVVLTFLAGGVLALGMALWQRSFRQLAANLRFMLTTSAVRAAGGESPRFEPLAQTAGRMPYAVAIAAGTLLQLILVRSGGWALS
ncbi:A24 family peptidase [Aromatoleum anaerobium]|uniref:Prepilin peptidase n=1 Tax=Aromatoleum anaerobium TaxID=182180 RepID=A0ABX1PNJ1_9RHOO|nr:A24 family peptidase [Aromatoleum anaerobium]MCK0506465.1 A24 family peptidase [Aromatoleum anaerobium]